MTKKEFDELPEAQREAVQVLYERYSYEFGQSFTEFLRRCGAPTPLNPFVGVVADGMFHGVESDGYTHT